VVVGASISDMWASQFPDNQVPGIISLILNSWKTFTLPSDRAEVPMTRAFYAHLLSNQNRSCHLFRIDWESYVLDTEGKVLGRLDIRFTHGYDSAVYLSIECKLLRVRSPSGKFANLATEYVEEGMYRYFNGQYATRLNKGGMLGYVMDGDTPEAQKHVKSAIEDRRTQLKMGIRESLGASSLFPSNPDVKETRHQFGPDGAFVIHHIFLAMDA